MTVPLIIAFGSQVNGRATEMSDYDFGVLAKQPLSLADRVEISGYLAEKLSINEDKIDLIDFTSASPILKFEATRNGKLVDGDYVDFIRFKVRAFKEYVDTARFRRLREKVMAQKYA
ncbi:MAG: nucleotidyltransferase domain-containing protein [Candidatus Taylorbacteria bacterium]|nr:nucleotidyltransferase domain-containing protein [Candidatus Taylorbacteria bacterium]